MPRLPKLLVSSVVRGADQGDSHGGLYLVDLERQSFEQMLDWDNCNIDFAGRGADRGLRGIVVHDEVIYVAASDELYAFDRNFNILASYRNPYLKHCHEMWAHRGAVYLTSTGFDSILRFDLSARVFDFGIQLQRRGDALAARSFNPLLPGGPPPGAGFHLNSVYVDDRGVFTSGLRLPALVCLSPTVITIIADISLGAHNARPFGRGVIFNDTEHDALAWLLPERQISIPTPRYRPEELLYAGADDSGVARQAFGRGLCVLSDTLVAGGSSPTTVSVYDLTAEKRVMSINMTMDIRNAAHGMAVWPY